MSFSITKTIYSLNHTHKKKKKILNLFKKNIAMCIFLTINKLVRHDIMQFLWHNYFEQKLNKTGII